MSEIRQAGASQRRRYPTLSLEQAVSRLRVLYDAERMSPAPVDLVAKHWGFKSSNTGPASTTYSAVKQFGLIEETGAGAQRRASVSPRGRAILSAPPDVRDAELRKAALEPTMNALIWENLGSDTGSPASFSWYLTNDLGFSDTGAREFAKQYEATIRFAGLDKEHANREEAEEVDQGEPEPSLAVSPNPAVALPPQRAVRASSPEARTSRHAIPLIGGKQVILEGDFPLSEAAWRGFLAVLDAFKPGLVEEQPARETAVSEDSGAGEGPARRETPGTLLTP